MKSGIPAWQAQKALTNFVLSRLSPGGYLHLPGWKGHDDARVTARLKDGLELYFDSRIRGIGDWFQGFVHGGLWDLQALREAARSGTGTDRDLALILCAAIDQKRLPDDLAVSLRRERDPAAWQRLATIIWLVARDDEWDAWKKILRTLASDARSPVKSQPLPPWLK